MGPGRLDDRAAGLSIGDYTTYLGLALAVALIVVAIMYLRRRRSETAEPGDTRHDHAAAGARFRRPGPRGPAPALRRGVTHARHVLDAARTHETPSPLPGQRSRTPPRTPATAGTRPRPPPSSRRPSSTPHPPTPTPSRPSSASTSAHASRPTLTDHDVDAARDCLERLAIAFTPPPHDPVATHDAYGQAGTP
ncbi:hypothetical protein NKG05_28290 [Oerskovia sp. M15]